MACNEKKGTRGDSFKKLRKDLPLMGTSLHHEINRPGFFRVEPEKFGRASH
jgi:hypothetical protein